MRYSQHGLNERGYTMSMNRKDYNIIASTIGWHLRDYAPDSREWKAVIDCAAGIAADLRETNPRFDGDRFLTFVDEVANGERDINGRKAVNAEAAVN